MREEILVKKLQNGDVSVLEELIGMHYQEILRYCIWHAPDRTMAEDATQENFLKAVKYIGSCGFSGKFRAFLYKIAANTCMDMKKNKWNQHMAFMKVQDYLEYMAALKGMPKKEGRRRIDVLLEQVSLRDVKKKKIVKLSGGMKRRVGIAQALLNNPEVLILDEPTSGLNPGERVRFRNLLSEFAKDRIVVISTHIVSDVEYIANQNAIMKDGKIIENDTTEHLVHLVDGKIWECQIPSADLGKWERVLKIINLRNEADGSTSVRYLSEKAKTPDSVPAVPRLEDLYLWLFPQEGEMQV